MSNQNFPNEKFAQAMGLSADDMIDYESPAYNGFVAGVEAGREEARQIEGLGRITNEDDGYLTLQFVDEDAGQRFMQNYQITVEVDDMPEIRPDPIPTGVRIRTKDRAPEAGLIVKGWDKNGAVWAGYYGGDAKGAACDWWMPIPL